MDKLTYLLTCLSEECNEVGQRASKAIRFGINEIQPDHNKTNKERLVEEYNDLVAVMEILKEEGYINGMDDIGLKYDKKNKIKKYMEYSKELGILD